MNSPEKSYSTSPNHEPLKESPDLKRSMGEVALSNTMLGTSVANFYDAKNHFLRSNDRIAEVVIGVINKDNIEYKVVGSGEDYDQALLNSLDRMNEMETANTKSLARIKMSESAYVSFTKLEDYKPKIAPNRDFNEIPKYIEDIFMGDNEMMPDTYANTLNEPDWQLSLSNLLANYLSQYTDGKKLKKDLKINSLKHLTPEQAVKLSTVFVQKLSKYSNDDVARPYPTRADISTTTKLLQEGILNKNNEQWTGNGICRNVASNVKSVFESLKYTQDEFSMLNNTYCEFNVGMDGSGYEDSRKAAGHSDNLTNIDRTRGGHAWNSFITIDSKGSASVAICDMTWALDNEQNSPDYTESRSISNAIQLFEQSQDKDEAFEDLTLYADKAVKHSYLDRERSNMASSRNSREFITTEYLEVARKQLNENSEILEMPLSVLRCAKDMSDKLNSQEIETLFYLNKISNSDQQHQIIKIITENCESTKTIANSIAHKAERLIYTNDELQLLAYKAIENSTLSIENLANQNGNFRFRLRELCPEQLPPFNPENPADQLEINYLSAKNNIHTTSYNETIRYHKSHLKRIINNDIIYNKTITDISDYDLVKYFSKIKDIFSSKN